MIYCLISIQDLDLQLFQFINTGLSNIAFDYLMPALREKLVWLPFYVYLLVFTFVNFRWNVALLFVLSLGITVGLSDLGSSRLVKKNVERLRPCNDPDVKDMVSLRATCGRGYSFTSSHAANHFALVFFFIYTLGRLFKKLRWPLVCWAGLISFAQVYVGLHYPSDVIFGALLGAVIGMLMALAYNNFISDSIYQN